MLEILKQDKNIPYFITAGVIVFILKWFYTSASLNDVFFLLNPTAKFLSVVSGYDSVFSPVDGYYFAELQIVIDKSCSGFNLMLISFLLFVFLLVQNAKKGTTKVIAMVLSFLLAYVFTILVNTSRILISILVQSKTDVIFSTQKGLIHEAIGVATNITFLIIAYLFIDRFLNKRNAKLTKS